ncbi:SLAP domain-containing protein [Paraliobacillus sediminis]|uniref:SLAP domain-containing protein n=1 Tax=Paraliobacillus sediminis TaxID=1885916 RepID=UPI000E3D8DF5|nr:SLAP domain-containing protein [Paraliobacillus sediminis]
MQQLQFESAWDKTIADQDRKRIERIFSETNHHQVQDITLAPVTVAKNHKGELLVTVLIHNFTEESFRFHGKTLQYKEKNLIKATHTFGSPTLTITKQTSMPWTFIFPTDSLQADCSFKDGVVEILN